MKSFNKILIEIDNREPQTFKNLFSNLELNLIVSFKNLKQGDIILKNDNNEILLLIERKSIEDLLSSVKDNRYYEQINRFHQILKESPNLKIIYFIEGNKNNYGKETWEYKCLYSCLFSLIYKYKFQVILTSDINESFEFIYNLYQSLINFNFNSDNTIQTESLLLIKKSKIKKEEFQKYIINLIPNIGLSTAENILKYFNNNLLELIDKFKENKDIFNHIKINNRKISKSIISNLQIYFSEVIK